MPHYLTHKPHHRQGHGAGPPIVVLAGGAARRMGGGDKGLLPFGGATLLDAVLGRLAGQGAPVLLNAGGDAGRFARFGLDMLPDPAEAAGKGPLAGVLAALGWAAARGYAEIATVPTDTPFLPRDLVACLQAARRQAAAEVAYVVSNRRHPVIALWSTGLVSVLARALIEEDVRRVEGWLDRLDSVAVAFAAAPVDPFFNVNRPEDLAEAAVLARRLGPIP